MLIMAPELFRSDGGIARIMQLYLRAICDTAAPDDRIGYAALNDLSSTGPAMSKCGHRLACAIGCDHSKLRFIASVFRHGWVADRVLCAHLHHLSVVWLLSMVRPKLKYYLVAHGIDVWRPYSRLERAALHGAHRILCVSEYTRRQMLRFAPGLLPDRLIVVPNTFDPSFSQTGNKRREPSCVKGREMRPRILTVSRLFSADSYKGIDTLIEAMPAIRREFPQAQLRIVGDGDDRPRLAAIVRALGLDLGVHFTGRISDDELCAEYATCDLFALPSRKEGFGVVYLEAMAHGKPCLAARAGGAPEVVNDEVGALVDYGNTNQIATAVLDIINHPRDEDAILSRAKKFAMPFFKQRLSNALQS